MAYPSRHDDAGSLPTLLAEYGHLATQLTAASSSYAERLRVRLTELDADIERQIAAIPEE
ncbi:hypothetical protein DFQ14_10432 [Halopolyspora algeriensis]|uniref:Uncharacterized protein n=1 Tax=Halopolyspora algeriensis TaxID=1500506 RepID=A0A368VTN3_9ACTN|nr:hypothetical protein [Halopolyspora algeriensis]RCW44443.1 hypothetical protein DFQ14_10432 [Halopolyspora algeriensis]TQM55804.1 hypothetical protein FHU43_0580 [Halopolyspora algeriensis]